MNTLVQMRKRMVNWFFILVGVLAFSTHLQGSCVLVITIQNGDCDSDGNFYVEYQVNDTNPVSSTFDLKVNGTYHSTHPYGQPLYTVGPFVGDGVSTVALQIKDSGSSICITGGTSPTFPDCSATSCSITDLTITNLSCDGNYTSMVDISFNANNPVGTAGDLYIDGSYHSTLPYGPNPNVFLLPLFADALPHTFTIIDNGDPSCEAEEVAVINSCCYLYDLNLELGDCDSDGNFTIDFTIEGLDPIAPTFDVYVNGSFHSTENTGSSPYTIGPFVGDGSNVNVQIIQSHNGMNCTKDGDIIAPDCSASSCLLDNLFLNPHPCDSDGNVFIDVMFNVTNPVGTHYEIYVNGGFHQLESYTNTFITIGPFAGDGSSLTITLIDLDDNNCQVSGGVAIDDCGVPECAISNLLAEIGECDSDGNFTIDFEFDVANPAATTFEVYVNGSWYSTENYGSLFYTIGPFAGDGSNIHLLIKDSNDFNCAEDINITAPDCSANDCILDALVLNPHPCNSDGNVYVDVSFNATNPVGAHYEIYVNGGFYQLESYVNTFYTIGPLAGDGSNVTITLIDIDDNNCQVSGVVAIDDCGVPECAISNLLAEISECDSDGNFTIDFEFDVANPAAATFEVYVNGSWYSTENYGSLFYTIGPFAGDGSNIHLLIKDSNDFNCAEDINITAPDCSGSACLLDDLFLNPHPCDSDGNVFIDVMFNVTNPVGTHYDIYVNGSWDSQHPYTSTFTTIGPFAGDGSTLTILIKDATDFTCQVTDMVTIDDCGVPECAISNLLAEISECDSDGNFTIDFEFDVANPAAATFEVYVNGSWYSTENYGSIFYTIGPFTGDGSNIHLLIKDSNDFNCAEGINITAPDCSGSACLLDDLFLNPHPCDSDGNIFIDVMFNATNPVNTHYDIYVNGSWNGQYPYTSTFTTIGPFAGDGSTLTILIKDASDPDCQISDVLTVDDCGTAECEITNLIIEPSGCDADGNFTIEFDFDVLNPTGSTFFVHFQGTWSDELNYGAGPYTIGPFPAGNGYTFSMFIIDAGYSDCWLEGTGVAPDCSTGDCLTDLIITPHPCDSDGNVMFDISFNTMNAIGINYEVYIDGINYGTEPYSNVPYTFGPIAGDGAIHHFQIKDGADPNCMGEAFITVENCHTEDCQLDNLLLNPHPCDSDGNVYVDVLFNATNPVGTHYDIYVDGSWDSQHPYTSTFTTIGPFTGDGSNLTILVIDSDDNNCQVNSVVTIDDCGSEPCQMHNLDVWASDCDPNGIVNVEFDFFADNPIASTFDVYVDGVLITSFPYGSGPYNLGGFLGDGSTINVLVKDAADPNCAIDFNFTLPLCEDDASPCEMIHLELLANPCDSNGFVSVGFDLFVINPFGSGFNVYVDGNFLNYFAYPAGGFPLNVFPGDGSTIHVMIHDASDPNCYIEASLTLPICEDPPSDCEMHNLDVWAGDCDPNSFVNVEFDFFVDNPIASTFDVYVDGVLITSFPYGSGPYNLGGFLGDGSTIHVLVKDSEDLNCAIDFNYTLPLCEDVPADCEMSFLSLWTSDCDANGFVNAGFDFLVNNPTSGSFSVYVDGNFFGTFPYFAGNYSLGTFQGDGSTIHLLIMDNTDSNCAIDSSFPLPLCEDPPADCEMHNLDVWADACDPNGFVNVEFDFFADNPIASTFDVYVDGNLITSYPYGSGPFNLGAFLGDGSTIHVLVRDSADPNCSIDFNYTLPLCEDDPIDDCEMSNLNVWAGNCDPNGFANVEFVFYANNPTSASFSVYVDGNFIGSFPYFAPAYNLGAFIGDGSTIHILIMDDTNSNCVVDANFTLPNCPQTPADCEISNLNVWAGNCDANGLVDLEISLYVSNPPSATFDVYVDGNLIASYPYTTGQLILGGFQGDGSTIQVIIQDSEDPNCAEDFEFTLPVCNINPPQDCEITNLIVEAGECDPNGMVELEFDFGVINPVSTNFEIHINGTQTNTLAYGPGPFSLGFFPADGSAIFIEIKDASDENCSAYINFVMPVCTTPTPCSIDIVDLNVGNCVNGTFVLDLNLTGYGGVSGFHVYVNNVHIGTYPYGLPFYPLGVYLGDASTLFEATVVDAENSNCAASITIGPVDCSTEPECDLSALVVQSVCDNDGTYDLIIDCWSGNTLATFDLLQDGILVGTYNYSDLPLTLVDFASTGSAAVQFTISDNLISDCEATTVLNLPDCPNNEELIVWPGDANFNGITNNFDVLNIGLAYGTPGTSRSNPENSWNIEYLPDWPQHFIDQTNYKHADCNGDGMVDFGDRDIVYDNYNGTNDMFQGEDTQDFVPGAPPIFIDSTSIVVDQDVIWLPIHLGVQNNPAQNLYGIAFSIYFDATVELVAEVQSDFSNCWMGVEDLDLMTLVQPVVQAGKIDIAITGTDQISESGYGEILRLGVILIDNIEGKTQRTGKGIEFDRIRALDATGNTVDISTDLPSISFGDALKIYPNPAQHTVFLAGSDFADLQEVRMYAANGQLVYHSLNAKQIDVRQYRSGIYLLELLFPNERKVVKLNIAGN